MILITYTAEKVKIITAAAAMPALPRIVRRVTITPAINTPPAINRNDYNF